MLTETLGKYAIQTTIALTLLTLCNYSHSDIYRWVDKKGKVHLSDQRSAPDHAVIINNSSKSTKVGNTFRFTPDADTLLQENQRSPLGENTALSAGFWNSSRSTYEITSLIRFDISALIAEINTYPNKQVVAAGLQLFANTTDKIHPANTKTVTPTGHYSEKGDNAFYIKAVRNHWDEHTATWNQYYSDSNYTSALIRALPSIGVKGSGGNNSLDYNVDLTKLIQHCAKGNIREITLELRAQRRASTTEVAFYSREAEKDKRPLLRVDLQDN